jgi:hypothetical protein
MKKGKATFLTWNKSQTLAWFPQHSSLRLGRTIPRKNCSNGEKALEQVVLSDPLSSHDGRRNRMSARTFSTG